MEKKMLKGWKIWEKNNKIREQSKSFIIRKDVQNEKMHKTEKNKAEFLSMKKQDFRL